MKTIIYSSFKDKKYLLFILIFVLIFFLIFILKVNYDYYEYQINYVIGSEESNRLLEVVVNDANYEEVFKSDLIEKYYPVYNSNSVFSNQENYAINYYYNEELKYGRKLELDNEIVISIYTYNRLNLEKDDIGSYIIKFSYNEVIYEYLLVGVTNDNSADFYISINEYGNVFNPSNTKFYVLAKEYSNISKLQDYLEEYGYYSNTADTTRYMEINNVQNMQKIFLYLIIIVCLILIIFIRNIFKNMLINQNKNVALLKTLGFKNNNIIFILLLEFFVIIIASFLISFILSLIVNCFLDYSFITFIYILKNYGIIFFVMIFNLLLNINYVRKNIKNLDVLSSLEEL